MFLMKQCACEIIAQHVNIFSFFDFKVINVPTDIVSVFNIYNCITLEINGAVFDETIANYTNLITVYAILILSHK
jgi:hypothetical protein